MNMLLFLILFSLPISLLGLPRILLINTLCSYLLIGYKTTRLSKMPDQGGLRAREMLAGEHLLRIY